jgi:hypothetical protein
MHGPREGHQESRRRTSALTLLEQQSPCPTENALTVELKHVKFGFGKMKQKNKFLKLYDKGDEETCDLKRI